MNRFNRLRLAWSRRRATHVTTTDIRLRVEGGEPWLSALLAPDCHVDVEEPMVVLVGPGRGDTTIDHESHVPVVHYRSDGHPRVDTVFVQPRLANPTRLDVPEGTPDDLAALASAAAYRPTEEDAPYRDRHVRYREAHHQNVLRLLDEVLERAGLPGHGVRHDVTVVCVTNRPQNLGNVLTNYQRQLHPHKRLLLVTNSGDFDQDEVRAALGAIEGAMSMDVPPELPLGSCLNQAIERCQTRYFAKMDDDDQYGEHYLVDSLAAHHYAGSGVVGKHSHYVRIDDSGETYLRFPNREFEYTSFVAGGTLVVDLEVIGPVRFPDVSVGEDSEFIRRCQSSGVDVFAADRFNYLQCRTGDNTWELSVEELRRSSARASDAEIFL